MSQVSNIVISDKTNIDRDLDQHNYEMESTNFNLYSLLVKQIVHSNDEIEKEKSIIRNLQVFGPTFTEEEIDIAGKTQWLMKQQLFLPLIKNSKI